VDIFNATSGEWTTANLSVGRYGLAATSVQDLVLFGGGLANVTVSGGVFSNVVDIFNATSGEWTTANLSVARYQLAAASVNDLALFGGGLDNTFSEVVDIFHWASTTKTSTTTTIAHDSTNDVGVIAGSVIGGIVGVALIVLIIGFYLQRKRRLSKTINSNSMELRTTSLVAVASKLELGVVPSTVKDVTVQERIGSGAFGDVFRGLMNVMM
jgi:hypothetical protein